MNDKLIGMIMGIIDKRTGESLDECVLEEIATQILKAIPKKQGEVIAEGEIGKDLVISIEKILQEFNKRKGIKCQLIIKEDK